MRAFQVGDILGFTYVNHSGNLEERRIVFLGLDFGSNEFYPGPTWLLRGWCTKRNAPRSFDLTKINGNAISVHNRNVS